MKLKLTRDRNFRWIIFNLYIFMQYFFLFKISSPPNLRISGDFLTSIIVDSSPIEDLPPSNTYLIFFPKSSLTSDEQTALNLFERLALGAAKGNFNLFNKFLVIGCFGNLTANVFFLLVTNFEILEFFFKSKTNVIGPGQNF